MKKIIQMFQTTNQHWVFWRTPAEFPPDHQLVLDKMAMALSPSHTLPPKCIEPKPWHVVFPELDAKIYRKAL